MTIPDSLINNLTNLIATVTVGVMVGISQWVGKRKRDETAVKVDVVAQKTDVAIDKMDKAASRIEDVHALVNGGRTTLLQTVLLSARTLAATTGKPEHLALAEAAQKAFNDQKDALEAESKNKETK